MLVCEIITSSSLCQPEGRNRILPCEAMALTLKCAEVSQLREESTKSLKKMLVASLAAKKATNSIVHPAVAAAHDYILGEKVCVFYCTYRYI